jgi:hypothetical protein
MVEVHDPSFQVHNLALPRTHSSAGTQVVFPVHFQASCPLPVPSVDLCPSIHFFGLHCSLSLRPFVCPLVSPSLPLELAVLSLLRHVAGPQVANATFSGLKPMVEQHLGNLAAIMVPTCALQSPLLAAHFVFDAKHFHRAPHCLAPNSSGFGLGWRLIVRTAVEQDGSSPQDIATSYQVTDVAPLVASSCGAASHLPRSSLSSANALLRCTCMESSPLTFQYVVHGHSYPNAESSCPSL